MGASWPTTWSALAVAKVFFGNADAFFSGFLFFGVFYPTNPLVSGEWGDIFPSGEGFGG